METYLALTQAKACLRLLQERIVKTIRRLEDEDLKDLEFRNDFLQCHLDDKEHIESALSHIDHLINRYFDQMD